MDKKIASIVILGIMLSFSDWHKQFCTKDHYGIKPNEVESTVTPYIKDVEPVIKTLPPKKISTKKTTNKLPYKKEPNNDNRTGIHRHIRQTKDI